jgi:hypothetical protein
MAKEHAMTPRHDGDASLRRTLPVVALIALALAAAGTLLTQQRPAAHALAQDAASPPPASAGRAGAPAEPLLDHSVVERLERIDEPDMTGASIGAFGPL